MQLYLIRHAIAVTVSPRVSTANGERELTEAGAEKMRMHARALKKMKIKPDVVLTSPLLRAKQTAEIVCEALGCPDRIERCDALAPGCEVDAIWEVLRAHQSANCVALVGHNPDLESLTAALIGGPDAGVVFKKGAICRIDLRQLSPEPSGELIWLLTPKLLRMMAK